MLVAAPVAEAHALPSINTARVMESMHGSEMRVGMHSTEFGNVSVSALLNRQSLAAQISFEHMDLGKALTAHLPSIEAKLSSEYGMQAKVEIRDQSTASTGDSGPGNGGRQESTSSRMVSMSPAGIGLGGGVDALAAGNSSPGGLLESNRLDVQA